MGHCSDMVSHYFNAWILTIGHQQFTFFNNTVFKRYQDYESIKCGVIRRYQGVKIPFVLNIFKKQDKIISRGAGRREPLPAENILSGFLEQCVIKSVD